MSLNASIYHLLFCPSKCERRVYLHAHGEPKSEPSEFDKLIEELGRRHEAKHLAAFSHYEDISDGNIEERTAKTLQAIEKGVEVIYQGVFQSKLPNSDIAVVGIPDFLIRDGNGYKIRDCKLARHTEKGRHEEISLQLELYGWLYEQNCRESPTALEVYLGDESIAQVTYTNGKLSIQTLEKIWKLAQQADEPYSPVGWSKCSGCVFKERCWKIAEEKKDVALVYGVDQGIAISLKKQGVTTFEELLQRFDQKSLSELKKSHGKKIISVGKAAERILLQAEALRTGKRKNLHLIDLPLADNMVMFDLEGLPPQFDELDKIYLWGTQVFGLKPSKYMAALAGFGDTGDQEGWNIFLRNAKSIFDEYGDIPFFHWHHYETTKVKIYIGRYGDKNGIGQRVLKNCIDLLKITHDGLVLPEYSYSLKVVEKRTGFKRTMDEYGGDWSIVQYVRAVETNDENLRQNIMSNIQKYNEEDLLATWEVLRWLKLIVKMNQEPDSEESQRQFQESFKSSSGILEHLSDETINILSEFTTGLGMKELDSILEKECDKLSDLFLKDVAAFRQWEEKDLQSHLKNLRQQEIYQNKAGILLEEKSSFEPWKGTQKELAQKALDLYNKREYRYISDACKAMVVAYSIDGKQINLASLYNQAKQLNT